MCGTQSVWGDMVLEGGAQWHGEYQMLAFNQAHGWGEGGQGCRADLEAHQEFLTSLFTTPLPALLSLGQFDKYKWAYLYNSILIPLINNDIECSYIYMLFLCISFTAYRTDYIICGACYKMEVWMPLVQKALRISRWWQWSIKPITGPFQKAGVLCNCPSHATMELALTPNCVLMFFTFLYVFLLSSWFFQALYTGNILIFCRIHCKSSFSH